MNLASPSALMVRLAICVVCAGLALAGRGAARRAGLFVAAGAMLTGAVQVVATPGWVEALTILVEGGVLVALASLAWKPRALWPLVLVALQGLIVALCVMRMAEPDLRPSTFLIATAVVSLALVATLARATTTSHRAAHLSS